MNTKKTSNNFRGFGVYFLLILAVVCIWAWLNGQTTTSSYTRQQLQKDLAEAGKVTYIEIIQNREIPTGNLQVRFDTGETKVLYTSDVNETQQLLDDAGFTSYVVSDVPEESWIMTLLPYLLIFGAFFILFMIMTNQAAAQGGGNKMMNFGKSRAKLST